MNLMLVGRNRIVKYTFEDCTLAAVVDIDTRLRGVGLEFGDAPKNSPIAS